MSLVLSNARLDDGKTVNIEISGQRITKITNENQVIRKDSEVHDLQGWLVLPSMVEPHAHLDKALTAETVPNHTNDLTGAINAWITASEAGAFTYDDVFERASKAMELLLLSGVTTVRTHVNVSSGTTNLLAVRDAASHLSDLIDVQIVALPSNPMTGAEGQINRSALDAAIEIGVDLLGGCPHLDPDSAGLISHSLDVATAAGIGLDLHVDEMLDPSVLTLRNLARQVIDKSFEYPVTASHCVTLGMQDINVQESVAQEVAEAKISVITLPQTNLFLQGRQHPTATPRGLTPITVLRDAGVTVAAGADNVQDPFNLVGRSDPLETASLLVMAGHQTPTEAYQLVSENPRSVLGIHPSKIHTGSIADLVAIDTPSVRSAIADAPFSRRVYRHGLLVASTDQKSHIGYENQKFSR